MGIKSILTLFAVGGIAGAAYFYRDGIQEAFADGKGFVSGVKDTLQGGSGGGSGNSDDGNNQNSAPNTTFVFESQPDNNNKGNAGKGQNTTQVIFVPLSGGTNSLQQSGDADAVSNTKSNPSITEFIKTSNKKTARVLDNGFSPQSDRNNPVAFEKRKFGIDNDLLTKAVSKTPSKRTITERKQIEAEKARQIFDSRSISNF